MMELCTGTQGRPRIANSLISQILKLPPLLASSHEQIVPIYHNLTMPADTVGRRLAPPGGTLEKRLKERGGRLEPVEAAVALRQMLRGVLCCHAHGLAHHDLKPDNLIYGAPVCRAPMARICSHAPLSCFS
eukprot:SAG11_NODE_7324_length_1160_cov_1.357210_2_plen_131_part_00